MPFYDLRCNSCNKESNIKATMTEKTENRIPCPECGSTDMETVYNAPPAFIKNNSDTLPSCPSSTTCGNQGCRFAG